MHAHQPATNCLPELHQSILVVEDHEDTRASLKQLLELSLGAAVDVAENGDEGLRMLLEGDYSLVITDLRMPGLDGIEFVQEIARRKLPVTMVVLTGQGSIDDAVQAMRMGAYDFLTKPADPRHLCLLVERALKQRALQDEANSLRRRLADKHSVQNILSKNPRMEKIFELIGQVAETSSTILIEGETGTGKELIARAIHEASSRSRRGPIVAINCAALPETLLESELFGHEKGSFTGAAGQRRGRFEKADKGTLFLDEVGDVPMAMQVKLLRVLQERQFERVGGTETIGIDVRVIAATNRPLEKLVQSGTLREDLYYRLNVIKIELPPLRERPEDIPLLAAHFAQKYRMNGKCPELSPETLEVLLNYSWPGNIRQMENAMERACVTARDEVIRPANLPEEICEPRTSNPPFLIDLSRTLTEQMSELTSAFEIRYLRKALKRTRGHVGNCAKISGLSRRSVTDKIAQHGIDRSGFEAEE